MSKMGIGFIVVGILLVVTCIWATINVSKWYVFTSFLVTTYWMVGACWLDRRVDTKLN